MKSKILILALLAIAIEQTTPAAITVEESTDAQFLKNNGYSALTADTVGISKARAQGQEYYTEKELNYRKKNKAARFFWKFYQYTDPAAEDYSFFHHDTESYPVPTDL